MISLPKDFSRAETDSVIYKKWVMTLEHLNIKMEEFLDTKKKEMDETIKPMYTRLKTAHNELIDIESEALSLRHNIMEQLYTYLDKLAKVNMTIREAKSDRWLFYATGFKLKTNLGEKSILIDGEMSKLELNKNLLENHIEYLRDCKNQTDNIRWAIKNKIQLSDILS